MKKLLVCGAILIGLYAVIQQSDSEIAYNIRRTGRALVSIAIGSPRSQAEQERDNRADKAAHSHIQKPVGQIVFTQPIMACGNINNVMPALDSSRSAARASDCEMLSANREWIVWEVRQEELGLIGLGPTAKTAYCVTSTYLIGPATDPVECFWVLPLKKYHVKSFTKD